ncbi:hypothetical protein [Streptomyces decoyicus]|uniref:hypothetical protein n=1 Tax=Streptomyces decoyicus TaxID=249567 RepID=UPI0033AFCCED
MTDGRPLRVLITTPHPDIAPLPPAAHCEPGVRVLRAVPFSPLEGSRPLELDPWLPGNTGRGAVALVLFVHGAAWRRGLRDDMAC